MNNNIFIFVFLGIFSLGAFCESTKFKPTKHALQKCQKLKDDKKSWHKCLVKLSKIDSSNSKLQKNPPKPEASQEVPSRPVALKTPYIERHHEKGYFTFGGVLSDSDKCWSFLPATIFCTDYLCVVWQKSDKYPELSENKMAQLLNITEKYIEFGRSIMNYDPKPRLNKLTTLADGKSRVWRIDVSDFLCKSFGGASYNGEAWNGLPKEPVLRLVNSLDTAKIQMPQVLLYELGRSLYPLDFDEILDWQMEDESKRGYWTLGFNGALTVLASEHFKWDLFYWGGDNDLRDFKQARLSDINNYIKNKKWNFDNAWSVWLLPWEPGQSINDMMTGLLLLMADRFGGIKFISALTKHLFKQPKTPSKTDRKQRATNFYNATKAAGKELGINLSEIDKLFKQDLRWTFLP